jgi:hypothetical protein
MCYSVHFYKVSVNTPTNTQLILLYNNWPTFFDRLGSSSTVSLQTHPTQHAQLRTGHVISTPLHTQFVTCPHRMRMH